MTLVHDVMPGAHEADDRVEPSMERPGKTPSIKRIARGAAVCAAAAIGWSADLTGGGVIMALILVAGLVVASGHDPGIWARNRKVRTAVIGSPGGTRALRDELAFAGVRRYTVVGTIDPAPHCRQPAAAGDEVLGGLADLRPIIRRHGIDLVLMTDKPSRMEVFDALADHCDDLRVRLSELSGFYEDVFGHIPVAVINAAWFQYILHPRYHPTPPPFKRVFDLVVSLMLLIVMLPVLAVAALLVGCKGGPILYRQVRIGEGGRPFTMYKLRTMRISCDGRPAWSWRGNPRVTRVGHVLRRTHIDELPQLFNVMRGEMSLVGPRPEQPHFVAQLERTLPFYSRRHTLKPGLTGWAQVHCSYAGSEDGSLWKLSYDLYYLKHRSMWLDLRILWRTLRTPLVREQYRDTRIIPFVFPTLIEPLQPAAPGVGVTAGAPPPPAGEVSLGDAAAAPAAMTIASADGATSR
jgi:exopolysaccharide biosynthesis polyprenyl glycosylphosphotransferase